jgi:hypothetical protein
MPQRSLEIVDEIAEPAVADADLAMCEAGRGLTWIGPSCTRTLPYC